MRASKLCNQRGCAELVRDGGAYCSVHLPIDGRPAYSTSTRTKPAQWNTVKNATLARARGRCYICGKRATEVDHWLPQAWGGDERRSNLRAMCAFHHRAKTQDESRIGQQIKAHPEDRKKLVSAFMNSW